jgi:biopolymer transport protein TolQ
MGRIETGSSWLQIPCFSFVTVTLFAHVMNQDFSIFTLVTQASLVVQLVMAGLLIASLASWTVIFSKLFGLKNVRVNNDAFEREFWAGKNLNDLYSDALHHPDGAPMERIFASGMREFMKLRERQVTDTGTLLDGARRAMRASFQREMDVIEANLSFLATVGSVSPYVGLFGTVWGIMHAFVGLANMTQVTLATVAPGIAEALVATAAIPAVIAYNRFARDIDRTAIRLETFIEEFSNILQRNSGSAISTATASAPHGVAY